MKEQWHVKPDYGHENVYRIWNDDDNYHDDTSPYAMDRRADLAQAAPDLLYACKQAVKTFQKNAYVDWDLILAAIAKAEGRTV